MNTDTYLKIIIGTASVLIGWVLAQVTASIRPRLERRRIIKLLLEELRDLDREITRLFYYHTRHLQLYGAKSIKHSGAIGLSNPVYVNYYKDAILSLKQNQRISFQMIHGLVAYQNEVLKDIHTTSNSILKDYRENGLTESVVNGGNQLGELSKAGYSNCAIIRWHINYHLERKSNPDLTPLSGEHKVYLQYLESVTKEINKAIESGKTIPKENFEKLFDEMSFSPPDL